VPLLNATAFFFYSPSFWFLFTLTNETILNKASSSIF